MKEDEYFGCCQVAGDLYGTILQTNVRAFAANPQGGLTMPGYDLFFTLLDKVKEDFRKEVTARDEDKTVDGEDD